MRQIFWRLAAICLLLIPGTQAGAQTTGSFPLKFDRHGRPLIEVSFENGDAHMLLLDTAARRTAFKNQLADRLNANMRSRSTIRHFSAAGVVALPLASLPEMNVFGKVVRQNVIALYPDYSPNIGLIGFDTLRGQVFRFDPHAMKVDVWSHSGHLANEGWTLLQGRPNRAWDIVLETRINGHDIDILVATGSSHTLLDLDAARKVFPNKNFKLFFGTWNVHRGLNAKPLNLDTIVLEDFSIGDWHLGDLEVGATRLRLAEDTGLKGKDVMILGSDVLMNGPIGLDFRQQAVWVPGNASR